MTLASNDETVALLVRIAEERDAYTAQHAKRVATYALAIARALGYETSAQHQLYHAGLLHDIGKIVTPESILLKPTALTPQEYARMQEHAAIGESILASVRSLHPLLPAIRHHHERYDGLGYPDGLKGEEIPLDARILAVADAFDAMTTNRIYCPKKTFNQAIEELTLLQYTQFDPLVATIACDYFQTFPAKAGEGTETLLF